MRTEVSDYRNILKKFSVGFFLSLGSFEYPQHIFYLRNKVFISQIKHMLWA